MGALQHGHGMHTGMMHARIRLTVTICYNYIGNHRGNLIVKHAYTSNRAGGTTEVPMHTLWFNTLGMPAGTAFRIDIEHGIDIARNVWDRMVSAGFGPVSSRP